MSSSSSENPRGKNSFGFSNPAIKSLLESIIFADIRASWLPLHGP